MLKPRPLTTKLENGSHLLKVIELVTMRSLMESWSPDLSVLDVFYLSQNHAAREY